MEKNQQIVSHPQAERENWTSAQAYILAVFCLVLGVALGYLFRGSASPAAETAAAAAPASAGQGHAGASPAHSGTAEGNVGRGTRTPARDAEDQS